MSLSSRALSAFVTSSLLASGLALGGLAPAQAASAHPAPSGAAATQRGLLGGLLSAVQLPVLSGSGALGSPLSVAAPVWNLLGVTNSFAWLRDGVPIAGATGTTYTPVAADAGHQITSQVTGSLLGALPVSVLSNPLSILSGTGGGSTDPTALLATVLPLLSGVPGVGQVLSVSPVQWNLPGVTSSTQWLRDGLPIVGATGSTYTPVADDAGHQITALVTGTLLGLVPVSVLSSAAAIPAASGGGGDPVGTVVATVLPLVSGLPVVGSTLSLVPGQFSVAGVLTSVQWLSNGVPIPGATGLSLPLTSDLAGSDVSALVTGTLAGIPVVSVLTGALGVGATASDVLAALNLPLVAGTGKVGSVLSATAPTWTTTGVTSSFQWLRNSVPIPGATGSTYTLTADDLAKQISVKVTGLKGSVTTALTSTPVLGALADALVAQTKPSIKGTPRPGSILTASTGVWSGVPTGGFVYRWLRDGHVISGATGSQYVVTGTDAGRSLSVLVAAPLSGAALGYDVSKSVKVAKAPATLSLAVAKGRLTHATRALATLTLRASGLKPAGKVKVYDGRKVLTTTTVRSTDNGRRLLKLPRLSKGKHVLRAVYAGSSSTAGAKSKPVTVRVH